MTGEKQKRKSKKFLDIAAVSAPVLARWLGVSGKTVYELAKAKIAVRTQRGLYDLEASVTRYCEHVRRTASQRGGEASLEAMRAQRIRIAKAQADSLEAKNLEAAGKTFSADLVEQTWSDTIRRSRALVLAVPSRCRQRLPHLTQHDVSEIDHELRAALTELGEGS